MMKLWHFSQVLAASYLAVACSPAPAPISAEWVEYTIPGELGGHAREQHLISEMDRRASAALIGKKIDSIRESMKTSDVNGNYALLGSALSADQAVYLYFAISYPNIAGGFGPTVRLCKVDIALASLPAEQSHDMAMQTADKIFREDNCKV